MFEATTESQRFHCCFTSASTWKADWRGAGEVAPWQTRPAAHTLGSNARPHQCNGSNWPVPHQMLRDSAEPQGFCHFLLIDNLLSLQMTQRTASEQKPRRKHSSTVFILGWAAGSRQVTCFSSPHLAQSSPQTLFQLLTTTTLKILA